jgi:endo-1,4-beta-xylanase
MRKDIVCITRRYFLAALGIAASTNAISAALDFSYLWAQTPKDDVGKERLFSVVGDSSLSQRAAKKMLIYGAASEQGPLYSDKDFASHFLRECCMLAAENELKWDRLRPTPYGFSFGPADWLMEFARKNNILFHAQTFVWHLALPGWFENFVNSRNAENVLRQHIAAVAGRYAGKIHSWDVVNEAVQPRDGQPGGLRNSPWLKLLGPNYIDIAFRSVAAADPQALLVLNQDQVEFDTRENEACRGAVLRLLERLKADGTPLHALGIQAHLVGADNRFNPNKFSLFLHDVASLGLKIMITEMDITDYGLPTDADVRDRIIASKYEDFLSVALEEPAVIAVITWGLSDKYAWLAKKPGHEKAVVRSLPLDRQFRRKLAWNAIARAIDNTGKR